MKNFHNLEGLIDLSTFPWIEVYSGLAKSHKNASIFYGHDKTAGQDLNLLAEDSYTNLTPEQRVWYRAVGGGHPLKGLDILLTTPKSWAGAWYRIDEPDWWSKNGNAAHFPTLLEWINKINVFSGTGRIIFFIQLQGQNTPPHVDEDQNNIPEGYSRQKEFLWLTPPTNPKKLLIDGVHAGNLVWFNNYTTHETVAEDNVRWSLRIDGKFTSEFKNRLGIS